MRRILGVSLAILTLTGATALAAESFPGQPGAPGLAAAGRVSPEQQKNASLRRTLASVVILKKLNLSDDQKQALSKVLADAKALREQAKSKVANAAPIEARQKLLEQAIAEARATGEVSPQTKEAMKNLRKQAREGVQPMRGEVKGLLERAKAILTPEQLDTLKGLGKRERVGEADGAGREGGEGFAARRHGRHGGKRMFVRILLSDEFAAELAR